MYILGLLLSVLVKDESTAILMALGTFYPLLLMSGIVWPVQGMPSELRLVVNLFGFVVDFIIMSF